MWWKRWVCGFLAADCRSIVSLERNKLSNQSQILVHKLIYTYLDLSHSLLEPSDVSRDDDDIGTFGGELAGGAPTHALGGARYQDSL